MAAAVIVYLASDGQVGKHKPVIEIELKDNQGVYHKGHDKEISLNCKENPLSIHVMHDMTQPVFKTVAVRIKFNASASYVGISGIALRSAEVEYYHKCNNKELYDPRTKRCRPYKEEALPCQRFYMEHANVSCTGNNDADKCHITCNKGYIPRDSFTSVCDLGEWKSAYTCQPVDCGLPKLRHIIPGEYEVFNYSILLYFIIAVFYMYKFATSLFYIHI